MDSNYYVRALKNAIGNLAPNVYGGTSKYDNPVGPDIASAWAGLGDYQLRANRFGDPGQTPTYAAGLNFPNDAKIPDYYRSFNTPVGVLDVMTNDGNPNIGASFEPNDKTQGYIQALKNLLGR